MHSEPAPDCQLCPRLAAYRETNRKAQPEWFNAPVPSFGDPGARLLIVGLAPGVQGANRTGRPFTGDYAGDLLYATLAMFRFSEGNYAADPKDGLQLRDCRITNSVRCVPPQNKPELSEVNNCRSYLDTTIQTMSQVKILLALGKIAHDSVVTARGLKPGRVKFAHGARHDIGSGLTLYDSYHCSRYNTNTRRLTPAMFEAVFADIYQHLKDL